MAEHAYLGPRAGPPLRPMTELAPLGQGLAGPTCPESQPRPRSAGPAKPGWAAGPGAGGHAPAALQPNLVSTPGVQMKKVRMPLTQRMMATPFNTLADTEPSPEPWKTKYGPFGVLVLQRMIVPTASLVLLLRMQLQVYNTAPQGDMAQLATRNANKTIK